MNPQQQDSQIYIPPQKKHTFIAMSLIIIVIIGAIGLYFAIKPRLDSAMKSGEENTEQTLEFLETEPKVEIMSLKLCDKVNEDFECIENTKRIFKKGDMFYVYTDVIANSADYEKGPAMRIVQEIKITNADGEEIFDQLDIGITKDTMDIGEYLLPISSDITIKDKLAENLGKYKLTVIITDENIRKETTKTIEYEVK